MLVSKSVSKPLLRQPEVQTVACCVLTGRGVAGSIFYCLLQTIARKIEL